MYHLLQSSGLVKLVKTVLSQTRNRPKKQKMLINSVPLRGGANLHNQLYNCLCIKSLFLLYFASSLYFACRDLLPFCWI